MIISALFAIIGVLIYILSLLLPSWTLASDTFTPLISIFQFLYGFNIIFPFRELIGFIVLAGLLELTFILARLSIGIVALIRGSGKPEI